MGGDIHTVTLADLEGFFTRVDERLQQEETVYLIGGSALLLLGNPRATLDIDYVGADTPQPATRLAAVIEKGYVTFDQLEALAQRLLKQASAFAIDPDAFRSHLDALRQAE